MNKKILPMFLLSILFLSSLSLFTNNVIGASQNYNTGFETGTTGQQFSNSFLTTRNMSLSTQTHCYVSTTTPRTGTKNFILSKYNVGTSLPLCYWNLSLNGQYLTKFDIWIGFSYPVGNRIYFYNNTLGLNNPIIYLNTTHGGAPNGKMYNVDFEGTKTPLGNYISYTGTPYKHLIIEILSNDSISISYNGTNVIDEPYKIMTNESLRHIDRIYFMFTGNAVTSNICIDDLNITTNSVFPSNTGGCDDMSSYSPVGYLTSGCDYQINSKELIKTYYVPVTTTIMGVKLRVSSIQYSDDSNLSHYLLWINDQYIGIASCFYVEDYYYILLWSCSVTLNNETPIFKFNHTTVSPNTNGRYWQIGIGCDSNTDIDSDGNIGFYSLQQGSYHWEWVYIPYFPYWIYTQRYDYSTQINYDLSMIWYHTSFITTDVFSYPDRLGLHQYLYKNTSGYVYKSYNPIILSYTLSSNIYSYGIELYKNGTQIYDSLFPKNVSYPSGSLGYLPTTKGKYFFKLKNYHYVYNITAYVIDNTDIFSIGTSPVITNQFESYTVFYKYFHPQNITGKVVLFDIREFTNNYLLSIYNKNIVKNEIANFTYNSNAKTSEYWTLFVNNTYQYSNIGNLHIHYIRIPSIYTNDIYPVFQNMNITNNNIEDKTQYIKGKHVFLGCNVYVTINGIKQSGTIGDTQEFQISYIPRKTGIYNCSLYVEQDGTQTLLDYCSFSVTLITTGTSGNTGLFFIPPPYSYFAGTFIIILLTLTPIIFGYMFKMSLSSIPQFLYLVFALLGFIISLLLGFFPMWSIIVLIIVGALIVVIMWLQRKQL